MRRSNPDYFMRSDSSSREASTSAGPTFAQDGAFYVGASIGKAEAKDVCTGVSGPGVTCDDKDTTWKIFGGYQFNRNFSAMSRSVLNEARQRLRICMLRDLAFAVH